MTTPSTPDSMLHAFKAAVSEAGHPELAELATYEPGRLMVPVRHVPTRAMLCALVRAIALVGMDAGPPWRCVTCTLANLQPCSHEDGKSWEAWRQALEV